MKKFAYILFFISSLSANAQKSSTNSDVNNLSNKLNYRVLNAYQENASTKIEDVFHYFQLLTDKSLNTKVKNEIILNINQLFNNQNPILLDITSENLDKIELEKLIKKLLISEPIMFKISNQNNYNSVTFNSWINNYTLIKTKSGFNKTISIVQTIFMEEEIKQFGVNFKTVWVTYLGEMQ